jgi:hypothetical protein
VIDINSAAEAALIFESKTDDDGRPTEILQNM